MTEEAVVARTCSVALQRAFDILGKRWNGMILDVLGPGPLSYVEIRRGVGGISDAMLSDRLGELVANDLVARTVREGPPLAVSYELSEAGLRLVPILDELAEWAAHSLEHPETVAHR